MSPLFLLIPILLPVIGGWALLLMHVTDERFRRIWSEGVVCLTSAAVWALLLFGRRDMAVIYEFIRGFRIEFRIDGMAALFAGMISVMWPLVMLYAFSYMEHDTRKNSFFTFYVMTYGITLGVAFAGDILTMYVFFELLTLVTIPLVEHYGDHASMRASRKYAAYTIGGAAAAFVAVILVTVDGENGDFLYGGILSGFFSEQVMRIAYLFAFFGFGVKAAVFPLHEWLPEASVAPTPVTALLHAVAVVNSGVFAVARVTWYSFGPGLIRGTWIQTVCMMTAAFTLVYAAAAALKQRHFKRRLAFSTVSNLSYMLFGILLLTEAGFAAGILHMLFHGIIKMTLFLCAGAFMHVTGKSYVYEINGVGKKMPAVFVCYTLGALSLTGIPLFAGFISKMKLIFAGIGEGSVWAAAGVLALIAAAFFCAMYTLSVSVRAFFPWQGTDRFANEPGIKDADFLMLFPIIFFCFCSLVLGMFPGPAVDFVTKISQGLL